MQALACFPWPQGRILPLECQPGCEARAPASPSRILHKELVSRWVASAAFAGAGGAPWGRPLAPRIMPRNRGCNLAARAS